MSWLSSEWKDGLSAVALQKVTEYERQIERLQRERTQRQMHVENLEQALEKRRKEIEEGRAMQHDAQREAADLGKRMEEAARENGRLQAAVQRLQKQLEQNAANLGNLVSTPEKSVGRSHAMLERQLEAAHVELRRAEAELQALRQAASASSTKDTEEKETSLEQKLDAMRREVVDAKSLLAEKGAALEEAGAKLAETQGVTVELREMVEAAEMRLLDHLAQRDAALQAVTAAFGDAGTSLTLDKLFDYVTAKFASGEEDLKSVRAELLESTVNREEQLQNYSMTTIRLEKEMADLKSENASQMEKIRELQAHCTDLEKATLEGQTCLLNRESELLRSLQIANETEAKLMLNLREKEETEQKYLLKLKEREEREGELQSKLKEREETQAELQSKLKDREETQAELQSKLKDREETEAELQSKLKEREETEAELQSKLNDRAADVSKLQDEISSLTDRISSLESHAAVRERDAARMRSQLMEDLGSTRQQLKDTNERLMTVLKERKAKEEAMRKDLGAITTTLVGACPGVLTTEGLPTLADLARMAETLITRHREELDRAERLLAESSAAQKKVVSMKLETLKLERSNLEEKLANATEANQQLLSRCRLLEVEVQETRADVKKTMERAEEMRSVERKAEEDLEKALQCAKEHLEKRSAEEAQREKELASALSASETVRQEMAVIKKGSHRLVSIFEAMKKECRCGAAKRMSDKICVPPRPASDAISRPACKDRSSSKPSSTASQSVPSAEALELRTSPKRTTRTLASTDRVAPKPSSTAEKRPASDAISGQHISPKRPVSLPTSKDRSSPKPSSTASRVPSEKRPSAEALELRTSPKRTTRTLVSTKRVAPKPSSTASPNSSQDDVTSSQTPHRRRSARLRAASSFSASQASSDSSALSQAEEAPKRDSSPIFEKEPKRRKSDAENVPPCSQRAALPERPSPSASPVLCNPPARGQPTTSPSSESEAQTAGRSLSLSKSHLTSRRGTARRGDAPECQQS